MGEERGEGGGGAGRRGEGRGEGRGEARARGWKGALLVTAVRGVEVRAARGETAALALRARCRHERIVAAIVVKVDADSERGVLARSRALRARAEHKDTEQLCGHQLGERSIGTLNVVARLV